MSKLYNNRIHISCIQLFSAYIHKSITENLSTPPYPTEPELGISLREHACSIKRLRLLAFSDCQRRKILIQMESGDIFGTNNCHHHGGNYWLKKTMYINHEWQIDPVRQAYGIVRCWFLLLDTLIVSWFSTVWKSSPLNFSVTLMF